MTDERDSDALYRMPGYLIRRCHQISVGIFHEICGQFDLTPIQYALMWGIESHPEIDQIQLSRLVGVDRTTIGNVILRLENRGLITRTSDAKDRRVKRLSLTGTGRALMSDVLPHVLTVQENLLAPLSGTERTAFIRLLGKIVSRKNTASRAPTGPSTH